MLRHFWGEGGAWNLRGNHNWFKMLFNWSFDLYVINNGLCPCIHPTEKGGGRSAVECIIGKCFAICKEKKSLHTQNNAKSLTAKLSPWSNLIWAVLVLIPVSPASHRVVYIVKRSGKHIFSSYRSVADRAIKQGIPICTEMTKTDSLESI